MKKGNWKKIMSILAATIGTTFVITSLVAKKEIGKSQYKDESNQMNPLEGKKVVFIENDDEIENADGVRGHLEAIGDSDYKVGFYEKYIKRGFDIVLSFGGLVVLSPILGAIALAIKIDDPGPVLFTQKRMGQNKKYFKLHKFRSMKMCTPHDVPTHQLENPEQYITRVGKFLRSHSLDELPQIWDIFIGNMSVIGPRPGLWNQDILTAERDKYNANDVKPGLTGWAQINGRDELEIPVKAKLDGEYVKHMGLIMDLKCFLGSVGVFAGDKSVVEGGTGEMKKKTGRLYTEGKSNEELIGNLGFGETVNVDLSAKKKVLIMLAPYIAKFYGMTILCPVLRVLGIRIIVAAVNSVQQAYVSRKMLFRKFFWSTLFGTVLSGVVGIILAYNNFGVWALVAQYLTNTCIDTIVLWITVKWRPDFAFSWERAKGLISYGWKLLCSGLLDTGYSQLRNMLIGKIYTSTDLAYYNQGDKYPQVLVKISYKIHMKSVCW